MKKDQYFNLEVNLLNDDNIACMMWMKLRWSGYFANSISSNWMRNDRCFVLLTWIG